MHISETQPGAGSLAGEDVHLADTGPGHADVAAHAVIPGARFGRPVPRLRSPEPRGAPPPRDLPTGVVFWTDWSEWQSSPYNGTYPYQFAMYRLSLGTTYVDLKGAANTAWCHANAGPGKPLSIGHGAYHVWYPGNEQGQATKFLGLAQRDSYFVAMVDVESWSGQIVGDHSTQITALCDLLSAALGTPKRVKLYGNSGDLAAIAPNVPAKYGRIKAGYSSTPPGEPWDGWQYSDGAAQWPVPAGWPRSAPPSGASDHNARYGTPADMAAAFGIDTGGNDPAMSAADVAALQASLNTMRIQMLQHLDGVITANKDDLNTRIQQMIGQLPKPPAAADIAAAIKADPPPGAPLTDAQIQALAATIAQAIPAATAPTYQATFEATPKP
jgi:hypothetical protein